jgi:hypothetical protein
MDEQQTERFQTREGDRWFTSAAVAFLRSSWFQRIMLTGVGAALGGLSGILVMRLLVIDRVEMQDQAHGGRMSAIEANAVLLTAQVDRNTLALEEMSRSAGGTNRAICLRTSRVDQDLAEMNCPPNLYLGAPRQ